MLHLRKALSSDGLAPKQKHVRWCSVYTWDTGNAVAFWDALERYPVNGQDQVALKALVLLHKVIREGHPSVLKESETRLEWLKGLANVSLYNSRGYVVIIKGYTNFLISKLQCHSNHPDFDSSFSYKEYTALMRVENPDECFETTSDLISLLEKIDSLQKLIFTSFRQGSSNEINVSALAPLVEESYSLYQFLVSFLTVMHKTVSSPAQALQPLRIRFSAVHTDMYYFYKNAKTIRYLMSIVAVPDLPKACPEFIDHDTEEDNKALGVISDQQSIQKPSNINPSASHSDITDLIEYEKRLHDEISLELEKQSRAPADISLVPQQLQYKSIHEMVTQSQTTFPQITQQQPQLDYQSLVNYIRSLLMYIRTLKERYDALQGDLYATRLQSSELQVKLDQIPPLLSEKDRKISSLEERLVGKENEKLEYFKSAQESAKISETKYNSLASLYSKLRTEHIAALEKCKELKLSSDKIAQVNAYEIDDLRRGLIARDELIANLKSSELYIRDQMVKATNEIQIRASNEASATDNISRLQKNLEDLNISMSVSERKHNMESNALSESLRFTREELAKKNEETTSLLARERDLANTNLDIARMNNLRFIKDILGHTFTQTCAVIDKLSYSISDPEITVKQVSPGDVLLHVELLLDLTQNLSSSALELWNSEKVIQPQDCKELISVVLSSPKILEDLLLKAKYFEGSYHSTNADQISGCLTSITSSLKNQITHCSPLSYNAEGAQTSLQSTQDAANKLKEIISSVGISDYPGESLGLTEEMQIFESGIENSTNMMQKIIDDSKKLPLPSNIDPSIFERVMLVLYSASTLAKKARHAQKDIEQNEKIGTNSPKEASYRTTSVWQKGLISAARSISDACITVVEDADGLIKGTRTREQLLVAAHEISAGAAHLITAARVRSYPGQESHAQLEHACVALRQSVLVLVREAMVSPEKSQRQPSESVFDDSNAEPQDNLNTLSEQKLKRMEMEQKVSIIELEKKLSDSRYRLGEILKMSYAKIS